MFKNYDGHGLPLRSCSRMREPHHAHEWPHPVIGLSHCWGRDPLPPDAEEKYCEPGCNCEFCVDIRKGIYSRWIMCYKRWERLSWQQRDVISESASD